MHIAVPLLPSIQYPITDSKHITKTTSAMKVTVTSLPILLLLGVGLAAPTADPAGLITRVRSARTYSWVSANCPSSEHVYDRYVNEGSCAAVPGASTVLVTLPSGCSSKLWSTLSLPAICEVGVVD